MYKKADHWEHIDSIKSLIRERGDEEDIEVRDRVKPGLDTAEEREVNMYVTDYDSERT